MDPNETDVVAPVASGPFKLTKLTKLTAVKTAPKANPTPANPKAETETETETAEATPVLRSQLGKYLTSLN